MQTDCYRSTTKPSHKVLLLFRLSDLIPEELQNIHCANEYHWRPEPGKVAGRPLLDCSNAPPGIIPLNSDFTRLCGIERYQQVKLPANAKLRHKVTSTCAHTSVQTGDTRPSDTQTAHTAGLKTDTEPPPFGSVVINVQGATFVLPTPDADILDRTAHMAIEYYNIITRTPSAPANPVELRATLQRLTVSFSRVEAERIAPRAGFRISDEQLKPDIITHW